PPDAEARRTFGERVVHQADWLVGGRLAARRLRIEGLGHAWSGGDGSHDYFDPAPPEATALILDFLAGQARQGPGRFRSILQNTRHPAGAGNGRRIVSALVASRGRLGGGLSRGAAGAARAVAAAARGDRGKGRGLAAGTGRTVRADLRRLRVDRAPRHDPLAASALLRLLPDRKSTRLNSSHVKISYAVFCLKKKNNYKNIIPHSRHHVHLIRLRLAI